MNGMPTGHRPEHHKYFHKVSKYGKISMVSFVFYGEDGADKMGSTKYTLNLSKLGSITTRADRLYTCGYYVTEMI